MHKLIVMMKGKAPRQVALPSGRTCIGRDAHNTLVLDSTQVSRSHAEIVATDDAVVVVDLRSSNGTRVNGLKVGHQGLQHRDLIALGDVQLRFLAAGSSQFEPETLSLAADSRAASLEERAAFARALAAGH